MRYITLMVSVVLTYVFLMDLGRDTILQSILFTALFMGMTMGLFLFMYYFVLYQGARFSYDNQLKEMKGGGYNAKKNKTRIKRG